MISFKISNMLMAMTSLFLMHWEIKHIYIYKDLSHYSSFEKMNHNTLLASDLAAKILLLLPSYCNIIRQAGLLRDNWNGTFFFLLFKCNSKVVSQTHSNITILNERQLLKCMCYFLPVLVQEGEMGLKRHFASPPWHAETKTWPHTSTLHSELRPKGLYLLLPVFGFTWVR